MADISECAVAEQRSLKETCYRHLAYESEKQSYIAPSETGTECKYYWDVSGRFGHDG